MVEILFQCAECSTHMCVTGTLAGRHFRCPECENKVQAPNTTFVFHCPKCLTEFSSANDMKNTSCRCPNCEEVILIPQCTTLRCRECAVLIEIDDENYLEFEGKSVLCPECGADIEVPARPHESELADQNGSGGNMPPGFGNKTLRLDEIIDNIPQAEQLKKGRCPYCGRPIWKMDEKSFACRNCGRLIQPVTRSVNRGQSQ